MQGVPTLTLLIFQAGSFFVVKGCPAHCRMCIRGAYPLDTRSAAIHFGMTTKIISRRHQMFSRGPKHPGIRTNALIWKVKFSEPVATSFCHHSPSACLDRYVPWQWSLYLWTQGSHFPPLPWPVTETALAVKKLIVSILLAFVRRNLELLSLRVNASISTSNPRTLQSQWL